MKITATKDGPIIIGFDKENKIKLNRGYGEEEIRADHLALCRCGASKNKPFCDGSHHEIGFKAEESEIELEFKE